MRVRENRKVRVRTPREICGRVFFFITNFSNMPRERERERETYARESEGARARE